MAGYVRFSLSPDIKGKIEEDSLKVAAIFPSAVKTKGDGKSPLRLRRPVASRLNSELLYLPPLKKVVKPKDEEGFWEKLEELSATNPELFERYFPMPFRMKNGYYEVFLTYELDLRYGVGRAAYYPWLGGFVKEIGGRSAPWIAALNILKTAINLNTAIERYNQGLSLLPEGAKQWEYEIGMKQVLPRWQRMLAGGIGSALGVGAAMMVAPYLPWGDFKYALVSALGLKGLTSLLIKDELRMLGISFYHLQQKTEEEGLERKKIIGGTTALASLLVTPSVLVAEGIRAFLLGKGILSNPAQALISSFPLNPSTFLHSPAKLASNRFSMGVGNFLAGAMYLNFGYWGAVAYSGIVNLLPIVLPPLYLQFRDPFQNASGEEKVKMPSYYPVYLDDIPSLDPELLK